MKKVSKKMTEDVKEKSIRQSDRIKKSADPVSKPSLETSLFGSSPDQNQTNRVIAATKDRAPKIPKTNGVIGFGPAVTSTGRKGPNACAGSGEEGRAGRLVLELNAGPPRRSMARGMFRSGQDAVPLWSLNKATPIKQARITNYQTPSYQSGSEENGEEVLHQAALPFNSDRLMTPNLPEDRKTGGIPNPTSVPNFRRQDSDEVMVIEPVTNNGNSQEVAEIAPIKPMDVEESKLDLIDISTPSPERLLAPGRLNDRSTGATDFKISDLGVKATSKTPSVRFWILQSRQPRMVWELWPSANLAEVNLASIFEVIRMYAKDCSDCLKVRLQTVQQSFSFQISRDEVEHFEDMKKFMLEAIEAENQNEGNNDVRPNIWISPPEKDHM